MSWSCIRHVLSLPPPSTSSPSASAAVQSEPDCDRCSTVPQRPGPEQCCQSQHPLLRGAEWDKCHRKPPGGKEGGSGAHLADKRFNHPALRTLHALQAPGTCWSQPAQLLAANILLYWCDGLRLRAGAMIELDNILIIACLKHTAPLGVQTKSISWPWQCKGGAVQGDGRCQITSQDCSWNGIRELCFVK